MNTKINDTVTKQLSSPARRAWSIPEVCAALTLSRGFLHGQIRAGKLKARRFGRRIVILDEDLTDYLAEALPVVDPRNHHKGRAS